MESPTRLLASDTPAVAGRTAAEPNAASRVCSRLHLSKKRPLGDTRYQCDDGKQGTLREDALGNIKETGTGTTWRRTRSAILRGAMALPIGNVLGTIAAAMPKPVNG